MGSGCVSPAAHPPQSKFLEEGDLWPLPWSLLCLLSKMTGQICLKKRTSRNLSYPVATWERAESAALQETERPWEAGHITFIQKIAPVHEGQTVKRLKLAFNY